MTENIIISRIWDLYREWQLATLKGLANIGSMKLNSLEEEVKAHSSCNGYIGHLCRVFEVEIIPRCKEDLTELEIEIEIDSF